MAETFLKSSNKFFINGYKIYRQDRPTTHGGGVAIAVKDTIKHTLLEPTTTSSIENISISINLNNNCVKFTSAYCPKFTSNFEKDMKLLYSSQNQFFIFGDFNAKNKSWNCKNTNQAGKILFDLQLKSNFFIYHSNSPTHYPVSGNTPSCLDILLSNSSFQISDLISIDDQLNSDHTPVFCSISAEFENSTSFVFNFKKANWKKFHHFINNSINLKSDFNIENSTINNIDSSISKLTNSILLAKENSVPMTKKHNFHFQISDTSKNCISYRNMIKRKWQRCSDLSIKSSLKSILTQCNQLIKQNIFLDRNLNWSNTLSNLTTGSSLFWQLKKRITNKSSFNIFKILNPLTNVPVYSDIDKVNCIADTFMLNHTLTKNDSFKHPIDNVVKDFIHQLNNSPMEDMISLTTPNEIKLIIRKFRPFKAPGIDGIQNILLKNLPKKAIVLLTLIFNGCLKIGYFPSCFKCAKIVPVLKPNKDPCQPVSYRPISLLSCLGKIFEGIILNRISTFINQNNIIIAEQFGFRSGHSTIHQVCRINNFISQNKSIKKSTGLVLLDIEKAFDTVWHDGLLFKLKKFGFSTSIIKLINSFLSKREFKVFLNGSFSDPKLIPAGIPQGSLLSPTLYSLFISDFIKPKNCEIALYADDTAIYSSSKQTRGIITKLQHGLNTIGKYFKKWKIKVNSDKTNAIIFPYNRSKRLLPRSNLFMDNSSIPFSNDVEYLGFILHKSHNFNHHIRYVCDKAIKCSRSLYPFLNRKSKLSIDNKMLLYTQVIRAIITYGSPVWFKSAQCHIQKLQIIQNKNLKIINNLPLRFSTMNLHEKINISTINGFINEFCSTFFSKCSYSIHPLVRDLNNE